MVFISILGFSLNWYNDKIKISKKISPYRVGHRSRNIALGSSGMLSSSRYLKNKAVYYSTKQGFNIDPWYITGLIDAEGSFGFTVSKSTKRSLGYALSICFEIALQASDKHILVKLKDYFGVGGVYQHTGNMYRYKVSSIKDTLNVIVPHFDKYPLVTQKKADFEIFKQILKILSKGPLKFSDLQEVINLKAGLNRGLSPVLKLAFPNTVVPSRQEIIFKGIPSPNWVCGFTEGEGSFYISLVKSSRLKTGVDVRLGFVLTQHSRDQALLIGLESFFGVGKFYLRSNQLAGDFKVTRLEDLNEKIIPFFFKYSFIGAKYISFKQLCMVAGLMKAKDHLTEKGLKKIRDIKSRTGF